MSQENLNKEHIDSNSYSILRHYHWWHIHQVGSHIWINCYFFAWSLKKGKWLIFSHYCEKKIKFNLKHVLLLAYNPHRIQTAYTISRIAKNNFEDKAKLKLSCLGLFVKMDKYSVIFSMLTEGLTK